MKAYIEERIQREMAAQATPEFIERNRKSSERFQRFQQFFKERKAAGHGSRVSWEETREAFHKWLANQETVKAVEVS